MFFLNYNLGQEFSRMAKRIHHQWDARQTYYLERLCYGGDGLVLTVDPPLVLVEVRSFKNL